MHSQQRKYGDETAEIVGWPVPLPVSSPKAERVTRHERPAEALHATLSVGPLARDSAARRVLTEVGRDFDVEMDLLLATGRCTAPIALARHVAMYLLHVELGRQLSEVGRLLRRDRTTVSHACAHVEDLREDSAFDSRIDAIELAIRAGTVPAEDEAGETDVAVA